MQHQTDTNSLYIYRRKTKTTMKTIKEFTLKKGDTEFEARKIDGSRSAAEYIRQFYSDDIEIYESCFILLLNRANNTIGYAKISQGGITGTVVDVKILCKYVVDSMASSVIIAHNHPSGNLRPSDADRNITSKIKSALVYLDSQLLDHVILTADGHYSFADEGLI